MRSILVFLLTICSNASAFLSRPSSSRCLFLQRLAYKVQLEKPLGIILEERGDDVGGVSISSLVEGGNAALSGAVAPGDVLVKVTDKDVVATDFDEIMELLGSSPSPVSLTLSDGLGTMDIAPNLAKRLSTEEAFYADAVVRQAVREIRRNRRLGNVLRVEIVIGAAVRKQDGACMVRFFAIFSTDNVSTYSCNVSATGIRRRGDDQIEILTLTCAKDEGLGQTIDLILENK